ncbi:homeobox protein Wariai [Hydra vulgaris]|uniref:Homeobox protein Wariai n=1 Tax=Hydra vulgaris TaxID=6087 RepID=A0ABM4DNI6_HYDVU
MDIFKAIENRDIKRINKLIRRKKQCVNERRNNETPLHLASERGYNEVILLLLENGAQVNTNNGSPLNSACQYGNLDAVELLLEYGADANTGCNIGNTPLHTASGCGNIGIICALLKHNVDVNAKNVDGWTPLHRASYHGKSDVVNLLLKEGADASMKTNTGKTPYDLACKMQHYEVAEQINKYKRETKLKLSEHVKCQKNDQNLNIKSLFQSKKDQLTAFISKKRETNFSNNQKSDEGTLDNLTQGRNSPSPPQGFRIEEVPIEKDKDKWRELKTNMLNFEKQFKSNTSNTVKKIAELKVFGNQNMQKEPENDSNDDKNDENEHECPICFELPLPPVHIYQCKNGHLFCGNCKDKPNMEKCPQCAVDICGVAFRNRYAEENIKKIYKDKIK